MVKGRKRFHDDLILETGYFLKLSIEERLFWLMLPLRCDTIGQFDLEGELFFAERMHGLKLDEEILFKKVNTHTERLRKLSQGRWWLTEFIRQQYGRLNPNCPPHRRYIKDLKDARLFDIFCSENPDLAPSTLGNNTLTKDYLNPIDSPEEKEEEADKEAEQETNTDLSIYKIADELLIPFSSRNNGVLFEEYAKCEYAIERLMMQGYSLNDSKEIVCSYLKELGKSDTNLSETLDSIGIKPEEPTIK